MNVPTREAAELVELIRTQFPSLPVPPYPEKMGQDPLGRDEYADFADTPWPEVPAKTYAQQAYDVSPAVGFTGYSPKHMWNYHLPGFMTASLLHEDQYEVIDSFMWSFRTALPSARAMPTDLPWWHGDTPYLYYSNEQAACVVRYLNHIKEFGSKPPYHFRWEPGDQRLLKSWIERPTWDLQSP